MKWSFRQFIHRLLDDAQALPHFFLAHHKAVVNIAVGSTGILKSKSS